MYIELLQLVFEMPVHRSQYAHDSIATKYCVKSAHTRFYCIPPDPDLWKASLQPGGLATRVHPSLVPRPQK